MRIDLSGRRALVTGAAHGIGRAAAETLARCGAVVFAGDLASENPVAAASAFGARGMVCDVTDAESVRAAFHEAGPVDIAVVNAGTAIPAALEETTPEIWQRQVELNLTGAFRTLQMAAAQMKKRRQGAIVVTASTNSYDGEPELSAYNATKAGLLGLVHTAAGELGPWNVRVNAVCPGLIRTRLTSKHFEAPEVLKSYFSQIPLGRGGEASEVAAVIAFLASDLASFITGATVLIDGGQMATKFGPWNEEMGRFAGDHWELK